MNGHEPATALVHGRETFEMPDVEGFDIPALDNFQADIMVNAGGDDRVADAEHVPHVEEFAGQRDVIDNNRHVGDEEGSAVVAAQRRSGGDTQEERASKV